MGNSVAFNSLLLFLLSFEIEHGMLPSANADPRVLETFGGDNAYLPIVRSLSSSHSPDERKMILTNSISDDDMEESNMTTNKPVNATSGNSSDLHPSASRNHTSEELPQIPEKTDPPIFNVIPDSDAEKDNSKSHEPEPESEFQSLPSSPQATSIVSDLMKEPQIFMDIIRLKWDRLKQIGAALVMFVAVLAIKALLTSWGPYLAAKLPLEAIGNVVAQEAGRQVLGNTIMYAISAMTDKFG